MLHEMAIQAQSRSFSFSRQYRYTILFTVAYRATLGSTTTQEDESTSTSMATSHMGDAVRVPVGRSGGLSLPLVSPYSYQLHLHPLCYTTYVNYRQYYIQTVLHTIYYSNIYL